MTSCSSALSKRSSTSINLEDTSPSHQVAAQREFLFDNLHRFLAYFRIFLFFLSFFFLSCSSSFLFFLLSFSLQGFLPHCECAIPAAPLSLFPRGCATPAAPLFSCFSFHSSTLLLLFFLSVSLTISFGFISFFRFRSTFPLCLFHSVHSVAFSFASSCIGKWVRNYFVFIPLILGFLRFIKALASGGGTFDHRFTVISPQENF